MTKNEFKQFAKDRGFTAHYSGKLKKFFLRKVNYNFKMNVHALINAKI